MKSTNDITLRLLEVYNQLKKEKEVKNASDFAKKVDVSNSMFTEICNGRSNAGIKIIQNTVKVYGHKFDAFWLLTGRHQEKIERLLANEPSELYGKASEEHEMNYNYLVKELRKKDQEIDRLNRLLENNSNNQKRTG